MLTYLSCNEDGQGPGQSEDSRRFHGCDNCVDLVMDIVSKASLKPSSEAGPRTYRLTAEWLPNDCAILDRVLRMPARRNHPPLANVDHVHHADDEVVARASALFFLVQSGDQVLAHIGSKVGRVQRDDLGLFFEEEHRGDGQWIELDALESWRAAPTRRRGVKDATKFPQMMTTVEGALAIRLKDRVCSTGIDGAMKCNRGLVSSSASSWPEVQRGQSRVAACE